MLKRLLLLLLFAFPVMAQRNVISFDAWMAMQTHTFPALDTNNAFTNANSFTNAGVFTNTQMNEYLQSLVNGCSPAAEWAAQFSGSSFATDALTGCLAIPAGAGVTNANAVTGYVNNSSTTINGVGGFFMARALVNSTHIWGINPVCGDAGKTGVECQNEFDSNVSSTTTFGNGILGFGTFSAQPTNFPFLEIAKPTQSGAGGLWTQGVRCDVGATQNGYCIFLNPIATGNSQISQLVEYQSTSSGGAAQFGNMILDSAGNFNIRPGSATFILTTSGQLLLPASGTIGNTAGTATQGLTTKTGSGSANYTNVNTAALIAVDTTNLCVSVLVPTGWKLTVTASGMAGTATGAVAANVALADAGITCTSGGVSALAGSNRQYTPAALATFDIGFTTQATITGDGAVHSVILVASTTNAADSWLIQNTAGLGPSMVGLLMPSN